MFVNCGLYAGMGNNPISNIDPNGEIFLNNLGKGIVDGLNMFVVVAPAPFVPVHMAILMAQGESFNSAWETTAMDHALDYLYENVFTDNSNSIVTSTNDPGEWIDYNDGDNRDFIDDIFFDKDQNENQIPGVSSYYYTPQTQGGGDCFPTALMYGLDYVGNSANRSSDDIINWVSYNMGYDIKKKGTRVNDVPRIMNQFISSESISRNPNDNISGVTTWQESLQNNRPILTDIQISSTRPDETHAVLVIGYNITDNYYIYVDPWDGIIKEIETSKIGMNYAYSLTQMY